MCEWHNALLDPPHYQETVLIEDKTGNYYTGFRAGDGRWWDVHNWIRIDAVAWMVIPKEDE